MELISFEVDDLLKTVDHSKRKSKIICTLGPACKDVERIVEMLDAGMNIARLNFSHGSHKMHGLMVEKLREAKKQRPGNQCAIMLDTKGPEIRTGLLVDHKPVTFQSGQHLEIVTDYSVEGDNTRIA